MQQGQPFAACHQVFALCGGGARGAKLAFPPARLMVPVTPTMLMQPKQTLRAHARVAQSLHQIRVQLSWNNRKVQRKSVPRKDLENRVEPIMRAPDVVISKEDVLSRSRVQCRRDGIQPM